MHIFTKMQFLDISYYKKWAKCPSWLYISFIDFNICIPLFKGKESNFNKYNHGVINTQETPYDINSIMHYGSKAFSKNGKVTIKYIPNPSATFGQRNGLSTNDKIAIINLYSCSGKY